MRAAALLAALLGALLLAGAAPDWASSVADSYVGREWNGGQMQCARTQFRLQDGALVGHYWIGDREPLEGDLRDFTALSGHSGSFIWTDRDGQGVLFIRFAEDGQSFSSLWGEGVPDPSHPGYGLRGPDAAVPGCTIPVSQSFFRSK